MLYSITTPNPPDKNDWDELKSSQKQCYPMMNKEVFFFSFENKHKNRRHMEFFIPLFPGYRKTYQ